MAIKTPRVPRVNNKTKNIARSFGYAAIDVMGQYNPTITRLARDTKNTISDVKSSMRNISTANVSKAAKEFVRTDQDSALNNLISDFKSGKWYNKSRGVGGFDDFDINSFEDWGDEVNSSDDSAFSDKNTVKAMAQSMKSMSGDLSQSLGMANIKSAQYIAKSNRQATRAVYDLTARGFNQVSTILLNINSKMDALVDSTKINVLSAQNSSIFYSRANEFFDTTTDKLNNINATLERIAENTDVLSSTPGGKYNKNKRTIDTLIFGNEFSFNDYFDMLKTNLKEQTEMYKTFATMGLDYMGKGGKNLSPMTSILTSVMDMAIPRAVKDSMKSLNETISAGLITALDRAITDKKSTGFAGFIQRILLPQGSSQLKMGTDKANYNKGQVAWDGIARKSLVEVIPTYLAKIYAFIGGDERYYDYELGKFVSARDIKSRLYITQNAHADAAGGDFRKDAKKKAEGNKQIESEIENYFRNAFRNRKEAAITPDRINDTKWLKKMGLSKESARVLDSLISEYQNTGDMSKLVKWQAQMAIETSRFNGRISKEEASGHSVLNNLDNGFGVSQDKFNMTQSDYLRGIYQMVGNIYASVGGGNKGDLFNISTKKISSGTTTGPKRDGATRSAYSGMDINTYGMSAEERRKYEQQQAIKKELKDAQENINESIDGIGETDNGGFASRVLHKIKVGKGKYDSLFAPVTVAINTLTSGISNLFWGTDSNKGVIEKLGEKIDSTFNNIKDKFNEKFKDIFDKFMEATGGKSFVSDIKDEAKKRFNNFKDSAGRFVMGNKYQARTVDQAALGKKVTKTGLVAVSEGELIIPSELNPFYNGTTNKAQQIRNENNIVNKFYGGYAKGGTIGENFYENGGLSGALGRIFQKGFGDIKDVAINIFGSSDPKETEAQKEKITQNMGELMGEAGKNRGALGLDAIKGAGLSLLGVTVLGPFAGAALAASTSLISRSEKVQQMLFGQKDGESDEEYEKSFRGKAKKFMLEKMPNIKKGAAIGAIAGLFGPFGIAGGMLLGGGMGFLSTSEKFKDFFFGKEGDKDSKKNAFTTLFKEKVLNQLDEIRGNFKNLFIGVGKKAFETLKNGFNKMTEKLGKSLEKTLIGRMIKKIGSGVGKVAKGLVKAPVKLVGGTLGGINKTLKRINEKHGFGVYEHQDEEELAAETAEVSEAPVQTAANGKGNIVGVIAAAIKKAKEGEQSVQTDAFGNVHQYTRNNQGELTEVVNDNETKSSRKAMNNFMSAVGQLPIIGGLVSKMSGLFGSLKDKLFGDKDKKPGLFDKILDFLSGKAKGVMSGLMEFLTGNPVTASIKGITKGLSLGNVLGGIVAPALFGAAVAGKFDTWFSDIMSKIPAIQGNNPEGTSTMDNNHSYTLDDGTAVQTDENGNPLTDGNGNYIDMQGNSVSGNLTMHGSNDSLSSRLKKNIANGVIRGNGSLLTAVGKVTAKSWKGMANKGNKIAGAVVNAVESKGVAGALANGVMSSISKALEFIPKILSKIPFLPKSLSSNADTLVTILYTHIDDAVKAAGKKVSAIAGKIADFMPVLNIAYSIGRGINAWGDAESILGITEKATTGQKVIAVLIAVLNSLIPFIGDLIPDKVFVNIFMEILPKIGIDVSDLAEEREAAQKEVEAYNLENGTDYTIEEYNQSVKGYGGVFTKLKNKAGGFVQDVKSKGLGQTLKDRTQGVRDKFTSFKESAGEKLNAVKEGIKSKAVEVGTKVKEGFVKAGGALNDIFGVTDLFDKMKSGDLKGLITYEPPTVKDDDTGIMEFAKNIPANLTKYVLFGPTLMSWAGHGIVNAVKKVTDKIKNGINTIKEQVQYGTDLFLSDEDTDLADYFKVEDPDPENPIGGIQKGIIIGARFAGAGGVILKWAGKQIKKAFDKLVGTVTGGFKKYFNNYNNIQDLAKSGDVEGLLNYQIEEDSENPVSGFNKAIITATKFINVPNAGLHWIGNKISDKFKEIVEKVKTSSQNIMANAQQIEMLSKSGDVQGLLNFQPFSPDPDNPMGGFSTAMVNINKFMHVPNASLHWVGNKIKEKFNQVVEIAKAGWANYSTNMTNIQELAKSGDPEGLLAYTPEDADPENPMGGFMNGIITVAKFANVPNAGIHWVGNKIIEGFNTITEKVKNGWANVSTNLDKIKELANSGDVSELINFTPEDADPENPIGGFTKGIITVAKYVHVPSAAVHWMGNKIGEFFDKLGNDIASDKDSLEKAKTEMEDLAKDGEVGKITSYSKPQFKSIIGGFYTFGFRISQVMNTVTGMFHKLVGPIENLWDKVRSLVKSDNDEDETSGSGSGIRKRSIYGGDSGFVSQLDPQYQGNKIAGDSFANKGCAPAVASMLTNGSVKDAVNASRGYQSSGGVNSDYFRDYLGKNGINTNYITGKNTSQGILNALASGQKVIIAGTDSNNKTKANSPFGKDTHYVLATGIDKNGNIITNDPENDKPVPYSVNILKAAKMGIVTNEKGRTRGRVVGGDTQQLPQYENLGSWSPITAEQLNQFIESKHPQNRDFIGKGDVFVEAGQKSGLDPRYILAHAAVESAWGGSNMARKSHNYYGIGAFDSNPANGYNYGNDGLKSGIVNGAVWIRKHYYDKGQTNVHNMRYNNGVHQYCTSNTWVDSIGKLMGQMPTNTKANYDSNINASPVDASINPSAGTSDDSYSSSGSAGSNGGFNLFSGGLMGLVGNIGSLFSQAFGGGLTDNSSSGSVSGDSGTSYGGGDIVPTNADTSFWMGAIRAVKSAIAGNHPGYQSPMYSTITVNGKQYKYRNDCTGLVDAAATVGGYLPEGRFPASYEWTSGVKDLKGFTKMGWPGWDRLQQGDIMALNGHAEIFDHNEGGKHYVWNGGSTNALNSTGPTGSSKSSYTTIYRRNDGVSGTGSGLFRIFGGGSDADAQRTEQQMIRQMNNSSKFNDSAVSNSSSTTDVIANNVISDSTLKAITENNKGIDPSLVAELIKSLSKLLSSIADNTSPIEKIYSLLASGELSNGVSGSGSGNSTASVNRSSNTSISKFKSGEVSDELIRLSGVLADIAKG